LQAQMERGSTKRICNLVDRIPDNEDALLPLPKALSSSNLQNLDSVLESALDSSNHSRESNHSRGSNHSNASSQSSSSRPRFEPSTGSGEAESARKKRHSNWTNNSVRSERSLSASVQSTDSAKFRSLLNQADTNDAGLYFNDNSSKASQSTDSGSVIPSMRLSYDAGSEAASPSNSFHQVSTLIRSFDKAWGETETRKSLLQTSQDIVQSDDEEDLYVENDEEEPGYASSASQELNELLQEEEEKKDETDIGNSFEGIEERLPFESNALDKALETGSLADDKKENDADTMASF
jgi:hypothetical protein